MVPEGFRLPPMWTIWGRGRGPKMGHSGCWDVRIASLTWGLWPLVGVFNVLWGDLWLKKYSQVIICSEEYPWGWKYSYVILGSPWQAWNHPRDGGQAWNHTRPRMRDQTMPNNNTVIIFISKTRRRAWSPPRPPSHLNYLSVPVLETKVLVSILSPLFPSFVGGGGRLLIITS